MKTILVADDSPIIQNIIEKSLKSEYNILKANDGYEVIKLIIDNPDSISGILLDLKMPKYDGFKVLEYFKSNNLFEKIPISIISGDDTKDTIDKAFEYDIVDMLNKPFSKDSILSIASKTVNR